MIQEWVESFFQCPSRGNDHGGHLTVHDYGQQDCRNGTAEWIFHFFAFVQMKMTDYFAGEKCRIVAEAGAT